jgi:hypothetical protein
MCDYCDCRSRPLLASLAADHEQIGLLAQRVAADDVDTDELLGLLDRHADDEEAGLYPELAASGIDTAELEAEHEAIHDGLRSTDPDEVLKATRRLALHIHVEEYDLFPAAHQLLDDAAWTRLSP